MFTYATAPSKYWPLPQQQIFPYYKCRHSWDQLRNTRFLDATLANLNQLVVCFGLANRARLYPDGSCIPQVYSEVVGSTYFNFNWNKQESYPFICRNIDTFPVLSYPIQQLIKKLMEFSHFRKMQPNPNQGWLKLITDSGNSNILPRVTTLSRPTATRRGEG